MDKNKGKNIYLDKIGVQGRKTGITLSQNVERDELGFQDIDSAFANIVEPSKDVADEEEEHDYDITSHSPPPVPAPASEYVRKAIQKGKDRQKKVNVPDFLKERQKRKEFFEFKKMYLPPCPDSKPQPNIVEILFQNEENEDKRKAIYDIFESELQGKLNTRQKVADSNSIAKADKMIQRKIKPSPSKFSIKEDGNSPVLNKPKIKPSVAKALVKSKSGLALRKTKKDFEQVEENGEHDDLNRIFTTPDTQFDCKPFALNTPFKNKPQTAVDNFVMEDMDLLDPKHSFIDSEYSPIFKTGENQVTQPAAGDLGTKISAGFQGAKGVVNKSNSKAKNTSAKQKTVAKIGRVKANLNEVVKIQTLVKSTQPTEPQGSKQVRPKDLKPGKGILSRIGAEEAQINLSADSVDATSNAIGLISTEFNKGEEARTKKGVKVKVTPIEKMPSLPQNPKNVNRPKVKDTGELQAPPTSQPVNQPGRRSQRSRTKPKRYWELETTACMYSDPEDDVKQEPKRARKSAPKLPKTVTKSKLTKETPGLELASGDQVQTAQLKNRAHEAGTSDSRSVGMEDSKEVIQTSHLLGLKRKKPALAQPSQILVSSSAESTGQPKSTATICSADLAPQATSLVTRIIPFPPQNTIVRKGSWFAYEKHLGDQLVTGSLHLDPNQDKPLPVDSYLGKWIFTVIKGRTEVLVNHLGSKVIQQGDVFLFDAGTTVHWFNHFEEECLLGYTKVPGI